MKELPSSLAQVFNIIKKYCYLPIGLLQWSDTPGMTEFYSHHSKNTYDHQSLNPLWKTKLTI